MKAETRRAAAKLSQAVLAARCGISQGHYSKMVRGVVPAGDRCERALEEWLEEQDEGAARAPISDGSAVRLAAKIRRDVARLATMMERVSSGKSGISRRVPDPDG